MLIYVVLANKLERAFPLVLDGLGHSFLGLRDELAMRFMGSRPMSGRVLFDEAIASTFCFLYD